MLKNNIPLYPSLRPLAYTQPIYHPLNHTSPITTNFTHLIITILFNN